LLERLKVTIDRSGGARQILLIVELDEADVERLTSRPHEFARFGLAIEPFGPGAVAERETTSLLGEIEAQALQRALAEMTARLREMEATPNSGRCNHDCPTYVELRLSDIERLFGSR
jgi:DNA mismatch repair protein MutL